MSSDMDTKPVVSVLMPVYNGEKYLAEAIESILNQTFDDFEFIIINDGSTDGTAGILERYRQQDHRIRIYDQSNQGVVTSLNRGLELAQGKYIARMDADDVSLPERFVAQVMFMEEHPEIGICGTWMAHIGKHSGKSWTPPIDDITMRCQLLFNVPLAHPSVMMRRTLFTDFNLRYPAYTHAEDYALWAQASLYTKFANIPKILLSYRHHDCQVGQLYWIETSSSTKRVHRDLLKRLGLHPTAGEIELHKALSDCGFLSDHKFIARANEWLMKLDLANQRTKTYPEPNFSRCLTERRFWRFPFKMSLTTSLHFAILTLSPPIVYTALRQLWRMRRKPTVNGIAKSHNE
jgi:glycosyltransferase involved in cell wall biosynthesis